MLTAVLAFLTITTFSLGVARFFYHRRKAPQTLTDATVLQILLPPNNDKSPLAAEQLFQSLHGILRKNKLAKSFFSLEIVAVHKGIYFLVVCGRRYKTFVENQIYAQYPQAQIKQIKDYTRLKQDSHKYSESVELGLEEKSYLPIKTFNNFEVDPMASITGALSKLEQGQSVWLQILARPVGNKWQDFGKSHVNLTRNKTDMEGKKTGLESGESQEISEIEKKNTKVGFQGRIRAISQGPNQISVQNIIEDLQASFKQFQTGHLNSITTKDDSSHFITKLLLGKRVKDKLTPIQKFQHRFLDDREKNIINIEELASLYHLPNKSVETPNVAWSKSRKLPPPNDLPNEKSKARIFGVTDFRNVHIHFGLKQPDRRRHMYILGKTGTGKSTMLKNMIVADIHDGKGCALLDPHGDLVEEVLASIPEHRIKDVVYLDPSDKDFPIGINMLDVKEGETVDLLADGIVSVFKKYFDSWGPRLQYILTNTILTLLNCQNVSLLAIQRILVDKNYRKFLLKQVDDPFLHQFWEQEFKDMESNKRLLTEAIAPIQNKVGRFLNSKMVRHMFGQVSSKIDLEDVMNNRKILLVNLSQGKIGEENSYLLGGLLVTRLFTNAMQRASVPESEREDFYLYVDEFQNFATETFVKILSEARKYALNLIVTHQYIDQISPEIQSAVFGNVGTLVNFVVGQQDAQKLEREYAPDLTSEDLINLEQFNIVTKMTINGTQSKPFTAKSIKPMLPIYKLNEAIKNNSREQYSTPVKTVEEKLNKWSQQKYDDRGNLVTKASMKKPSKAKKTKKKK